MNISRRKNGFSLVSLMITIVIIGIVAKLGHSTFTEQVRRGKIVNGLSTLVSYTTRLEGYYLRSTSYGGTGCSAVLPAATDGFAFDCVVSGNGHAFTATATGTGSVDGFVYTLDQVGIKRTFKFMGVVLPDPVPTCWWIKQGAC